MTTACQDSESTPALIVPVSSCSAHELALPDGSCMRPGIPSDGCAEGFVHDGEYGCEPVLPVDDCPPALMAVPGDPACRAIMPCGSGKWGDIPVDASTQYVDASYAGTMSDGSADRPWRRIQDGYTAVAPGGIIAVAEGSYQGVSVIDKAARIIGVCPEKVELLGTVVIGSDGTELRGVAVRGGVPAIGISGAEDVLLDRLWVHAAADRGLEVHALAGAVVARLSGSLVETNAEFALFLAGATLAIDTSVIRRTLPHPVTQDHGRGIHAQDCSVSDGCNMPRRSDLSVERSVLEDNYDLGMYMLGTDVTIDGTVVRRTLPQASDQHTGFGISIEVSCDATQCYPEMSSRATVRGSLVERSSTMGIAVIGSEAIIENTVVRDTSPRASHLDFGRGVAAEVKCPNGVCDPTMPSKVEVRRALIERNVDTGLFVMGTEALIEDTVVRHTSSRRLDEKFGRGVAVQPGCALGGSCNPEADATAQLRRVLIEDNYDVGLFVGDSAVGVETTVVRGTHARPDGGFGDGIAVISQIVPANVAASLVHVEDSARAGISNFGAFVSIGATAIQCATFDLEGEPLGQAFRFEDRGGNRCGCPIADATCIAVSPGLVPPQAFTE